MESIRVKVKKLHAEAILPAYQTDGAACFDLHACPTEWDINARAYGVTVTSGRPVTFRTGLAFEIPKGWAMLIFSRSGQGFKNGARLANCVGVIDSDYRGEVAVRIAVDGFGSLHVSANDRIAQAMIVPVPAVELVEVDELTPTERGANGFGSTGQ